VDHSRTASRKPSPREKLVTAEPTGGERRREVGTGVLMAAREEPVTSAGRIADDELQRASHGIVDCGERRNSERPLVDRPAAEVEIENVRIVIGGRR